MPTATAKASLQRPKNPKINQTKKIKNTAKT
jgi:hypothetical protein